MSIGNLKTEGNKGNNFPWQLKMLMGQQCACDQLTAIAANTDDVEFLLTSILNTLQASTEYEAKFVVDTCDSDKVYLEVRVWNLDTSTWGPITYYLPGSDTPVTPVGESTPGCLQYTDPGSLLALILTELQSQTIILTDIETDTTSIDVTLTNLFAAYSAGQQACASSLSVTLCTEQDTNLSNIDTNIDLLLTAFNAEDFATEATLLNVDNNIANIVGNTDGVLRSPNILRTSSLGNLSSVATEIYSVSVANVGIANGVVQGAELKPGETVNFDAGSLNHYFNGFAYDSTSTEFIIIYVS